MTSDNSAVVPIGLDLKLRRARAHLMRIRRIFRHFIRESPCTWHRELNQQGTHFVYRLDCPPGPETLMLLTDEAVHHMRSWLDHLLTGLIESEGRDASRCQFPIFLEQPTTQQESDRFAAMIAGVPEQVRPLIVGVQPYQSGKDAAKHPLAILNRLDNRFKHTSLDVFSYRVMAHLLDGALWRGGGSNPPLKRGDVFASIPSHYDVETYFEPSLKVFVAFQVKRTGLDLDVGLDTLFDVFNYLRDEISVKVIAGKAPARLDY